jgi:outer membrane immunogenic protein
MKALLFAVTMLVAAAGAAAADAAPIPPVPYAWTGFYVGGQAGWGFARTSSSFSGFDAGDTPPAVSPNGGGDIIGTQLGYNRQFGFWLAGLETDIAGAFIKGNASSVSTNGFTIPTEQDINWLGTLRGRLGILPADRLLLFVTGGLAYGGTTVSSISLPVGGNCVTSSCGSGSASATRAGWALGGGLEYAWSNNVTFKAEYLYVDLGSLSVTYPITLAVSKATTTSTFAANIVRVGLNMKLGAIGFGPGY